MFTALKILHLLALVLGSAASLGNIFITLSTGPHDLAAPGFTNTLRKMFRLSALFAIGIFWVSGLLMMFVAHGIWISGSGFSFKILVVFLLSISIFYLNFMASRWMRSGGPPAYVSILHWLNAALLVLAVVSAVAVFS